jgi:outer membrane biosynthesis protein TonB
VTNRNPISTLTSTATYVVRHPARTTLRAVGVAKGIASVGLSAAGHALGATRGPSEGSTDVWRDSVDRPTTATVVPPEPLSPPIPAPEPEPAPSPDPAPIPSPPPSPGPGPVPTPEPTPAPGPERVMLPPGERHAAEAEADLSVPTPGVPGEQYAHEPSATTRDSAHGGPSDDELVDGWDEDAREAEGTSLTP